MISGEAQGKQNQTYIRAGGVAYFLSCFLVGDVCVCVFFLVFILAKDAPTVPGRSVCVCVYVLKLTHAHQSTAK